ncbi:kinase-like domain-containing protein [Russula compacta]|nr:kinase-like domain-containing protein [Russula compacta]
MDALQPQPQQHVDIAAAPGGEYDYAGETQGATQQASQIFYGNDVHPMDRPFFGCLLPCNTVLRRIDFMKTRPNISVGRGPTNDFVLPGMRIVTIIVRLLGWTRGCSSQVIVHDNSTNGTWINGTRVLKGQSRILRDGNEIAFGSPMQQADPQDDFRFIYRHLAPLELTGIHAHYDMAHELGRGTFATVMKAMARTTGECNHNSNQLQNLAREISILETLDHPNICRLRETFVPEEGGHDFYLVLEYLEGGDLLDYILTHNGLSEPMAQHITRQICSALSYIHAKGITHRDLKPENVLLTRDNPPVIKVADFGLAKVVDSLTMLRTMCGTPNYLAPEVVLQDIRAKGYDHLVDSWSVGVIVFSMLTNAGPFIEDEAEPDIRRRIAGRTISWNVLQELGIGATAQSFIRCLLEVDPTMRMSLTEALVHPWLDPSAPSGSGTTRSSATARYSRNRSLSDVSELSELSELPEDDNPSMLSAEPSSDVMLGVHTLSLRSPAPANGRPRPPLERRSDVLARESEAEAAATAAPSTPSTSTNNNGGSSTGKRQRSGSPADVAMSGESCDDDAAAAAMETEPPSSRAAKRGRRNPGSGRQSSSSSSPPTVVGNGNGDGSSGRRVLRPRVAGTTGGSRR